MKILILKFIIVFYIIVSPVHAQDDIQIGSLKYQSRGLTGYYDFSDPTGINIKVQIWGYVRFPGYYVIPAKSYINDIISLAGGPTEEALLDDIRLLRFHQDSTIMIIKYNFKDLILDEPKTIKIEFPRLNASDMIIIPGEPRYFIREDINFILSVTTALASITAIILTILQQ